MFKFIKAYLQYKPWHIILICLLGSGLMSYLGEYPSPILAFLMIMIIDMVGFKFDRYLKGDGKNVSQ